MKFVIKHLERRGRWALIFVVIALMMTGGLLFAGGKTAVDATNTVEFCTSCHEMKDNNFKEYKNTIHASNRTGVKATCSDCHVPHEFGDKMIRKIKAANDIYHHMMGTIDTKEKFEKRRLELATRVWTRMKETDSRECRHCHDATSMSSELQGKTAQKQHQKIKSEGKTCIDCHYGIAHQEPAGGMEPRDVVGKHE